MKKIRRIVKNENEKWCPICGEIKNKSEFSKGGCKDGLHSYCKKCTSEMNSNYYENHKNYFKEYYETIKGLTNRLNATTKSRRYTENRLTEQQIKTFSKIFLTPLMEQVDHLVLYFYYTIIIFNCYRLYHTGGAYETNTFKRYH